MFGKSSKSSWPEKHGFFKKKGLTNIPPQTQATEDKASSFFPQIVYPVFIYTMDSPGETEITTTENVNIIPPYPYRFQRAN